METEAQQHAMTKPEPAEEHRWLQRFVGDWVFESESQGKPDEPVHKSTGVERIRPLGDYWIVAEGEGNMPDGCSGQFLITIGFDPATKRFNGTWIGSMMTHHWIYEGEREPDGNTLTLYADGPDFESPDTMAKYKDVLELVDDRRRRMESYVLGKDGQWQRFMTAEYRRQAE